MSDAKNYATFGEAYEAGKMIAGNHAADFKRSLFFFALAYTMQGLTYLSIYGVMVALFSASADARQAWAWFGLMTVFIVINVFARWFAHDFDYGDTTANITHNMRVKLGKKLRTIPLEVLGSYKTGDLNASLSSNVDESVMMLGMISGMFIEIFLTPVVVVIGMFFIDWRMAVLLTVIMPLAIPLYRRKRKSGAHEKMEMTQANSVLESDIIEYIQGLAVLRATNQTGENAKHLHEGIIHVRDLQRASVWGTIVNLVMGDMLILFALIMIAIWGSIRVGNGTMSIAAIAALLVIVSRLMEPLSLFLAITSALDIMNAGFARVKAVMKTPPLEVVNPQSKAQHFEIVFNNVEFTYHGQEEKALKNCTIKIPGQAMTAIVGPSGSGKTTITRLMMRYADPQAGTIMIGGIDIRRMSPKELLSYFAVVFQDVYLFDESIIENIRMAKSDATDEEVIKAAKAAFCHEFVERLPQGYQTGVGDIGGSLSGGERQRISIARAILKDAPIVILDEPTAALDTESEIAVQRAVETLIKDKTIIVIAHRLTTIAGADQILVIDDGALVEQGTHAFLLTQQGKYHDLWQAQLRSKTWRIKE
ncbi:ABC transporter ATP-binding protein [Desulfobacter curvatus]|uniref:ABC transporter ATP-binding protein n=1 Tax=Desulfobacter curvatus TaxID=2290 RepID=UPI00037B9941|nr:ABC transporter ATP-binding protein [Desulfobacter curvatus]